MRAHNDLHNSRALCRYMYRPLPNVLDRLVHVEKIKGLIAEITVGD